MSSERLKIAPSFDISDNNSGDFVEVFGMTFNKNRDRGKIILEDTEESDTNLRDSLSKFSMFSKESKARRDTNTLGTLGNEEDIEDRFMRFAKKVVEEEDSGAKIN